MGELELTFTIDFMKIYLEKSERKVVKMKIIMKKQNAMNQKK